MIISSYTVLGKWAGFAVFIGLSLLMMAGWGQYPGEAQVYISFCLSFLLLLLVAGYGQPSWVYLSLSLFWLIAYPIKLITHLFSETYYVEPVGWFGYSGSDYDHALMVSMFGIWGLILARLVPIEKVVVAFQDRQAVSLPTPSRREILLYICVLCSLVVANMHLKIFQVGLSAQTVLPYKLTSLVFWAFNLGIPCWLTFILWRIPNASEEETDKAVLLITGSAFLMAISILSRAPFIFLAAPLLFVLWGRARRVSTLTIKRVGMHVTIFVGMFAISVVLVSLLRAHAYQSGSDMARVQVNTLLSGSSSRSTAGSAAGSVDKNVIGSFLAANVYFAQISHLFIDRWIGLEGAAAVSAYPGKGWNLMEQAFKEPATSGSRGIYQHVTQSPFASANQLGSEKFIFGSEPGLIGFLYYSNQLWFVVVGVWITVMFAMFVERLASAIGKNPYFVAFIGVALANLIMQFVTPRAHGIVVIEILMTIVMLGLINRGVQIRSGR